MIDLAMHGKSIAIWFQIIYIRIFSTRDHMPLLMLFYLLAGGVATYIHADHFRSRIPKNIPVNAMADAGYVSYYIPCTHATHEYTAENFTIELTVDKEINF